MSGQLTLFDEAPPEAPDPGPGLALRVRAALGRGFENFAWWCDGGNQEMCAAVLWRRGFTPAEARAAVAFIGKEAQCKTP